MAKLLKYAIGLDIAKDKFDACLAVIDETQKVTIRSSKAGISNSPKGFDELLHWVKSIFLLRRPSFFAWKRQGFIMNSLSGFYIKRASRKCSGP